MGERYEALYTKKEAYRQTSLIGKILHRTGACSLYFDSGRWHVHCWLWHPLVWLVMFVSIFAFGITRIPEVIDDITLDKTNRKNPYWKAAKG